MMQFKKATKQSSKLRLAAFGPSGSGKTMSALRIATGIGGKIALLDSEHGSASKYADRFDFEVINLAKKDIAEVCEGIQAADQAGFNVLIIDSLSHAWQELLEDVEAIAKAKYRGNTWSAWSEGNPKQKRLVSTLLNSSCHIIATMRSKTEWVVEQNSNGKSAPKRVGMAPEQGKGIEYEFDMLMELSVDHVAHIEKDRTGKFQDKIIEKPDENFGREVAAWLSEGAAPTQQPAPQPPTQRAEAAPAQAPAPATPTAPEIKTGTPLTDAQKTELTEVTKAQGFKTQQVKDWCAQFLQSAVCGEVYDKLLDTVKNSPAAIRDSLPF